MSQYHGSHRSLSSNGYTEDTNGNRTFLANADIFARHSQKIVIGACYQPQNQQSQQLQHHQHLRQNQHRQQHQQLQHQQMQHQQLQHQQLQHQQHQQQQPPPPMISHIDYQRRRVTPGGRGDNSDNHGAQFDEDDDDDANTVCSRQTQSTVPLLGCHRTSRQYRNRSRSRSPSGFTDVCSSYQPGAAPKQQNKFIAIGNNVGYAVPSSIDRTKLAIIIDVDEQKRQFSVVDCDDSQRWIALSVDKVLKARNLCQPLGGVSTSEMVAIIEKLTPFQVVTVMKLRERRM